jgi:hypothetical protein
MSNCYFPIRYPLQESISSLANRWSVVAKSILVAWSSENFGWKLVAMPDTEKVPERLFRPTCGSALCQRSDDHGVLRPHCKHDQEV